MLRFFHYFKFTLVWIVFLTVLSSISSGKLEPFDWLDLASSDKIYHLLFYFIFVLLLAVECTRYTSQLQKSFNILLFSITVTFFFGALVEILQYLLNNGRKASIADQIANTVGILLGALIFGRIRSCLIKISAPFYRKQTDGSVR